MNRKYYIDHQEEIKEKSRNRYYQNKIIILEQKRLSYPNVRDVRLNQRRKSWRNNPQIKQNNVKYKKDIRSNLIAFMGGKCNDCVIDNPLLLTIDHVNNDGKCERHFLGIQMWVRILDGRLEKDRYQLLCWNCNEKKYRINPVHHYKRTITGDHKTCRVCKQCKDVGSFSSQKSNDKTRCLDCKNKSSWNQTLECYRKLGGFCKSCGESDCYKLCIDHINNDGGGVNRKLEGSGSKLCRKILMGTVDVTKYQLLCWNCNFMKWYSNTANQD